MTTTMTETNQEWYERELGFCRSHEANIAQAARAIVTAGGGTEAAYRKAAGFITHARCSISCLGGIPDEPDCGHPGAAEARAFHIATAPGRTTP